MEFTKELEGFTITARLEYDHDTPAPWIDCEGHGPVSDWRRRDYAGHHAKKPGELLLADDGGNAYRGSALFYDYAEACRIARAQGWNTPPYEVPGETPRQRAARAARADFERLKAWCDQEWYYGGVVLSVSRNGIMLDDSAASLWGVESDGEEHLLEVAEDLVEDALAVGRQVLETLTRD